MPIIKPNQFSKLPANDLAQKEIDDTINDATFAPVITGLESTASDSTNDWLQSLHDEEELATCFAVEDLNHTLKPEPDHDPEGHLTQAGAIRQLSDKQYALIIGPAGTGKSTLINAYNEANPGAVLVCATTGIAGVNLNTTTVNSVLGFYDTWTLQDNYMSGRLKRSLIKVANDYDNILIDEVSMLTGEKLNVISLAIRELNVERQGQGLKPIGLLLSGDPLQLPPVLKPNEDKLWFFESDTWDRFFEPNQIKLTKIWRQSSPILLSALAHIRAGNGMEGAKLLKLAGIPFTNAIDPDFIGTTIVSKNDKVDAVNSLALSKIPGKLITFKSRRWNQTDKKMSEWQYIPELLELKESAYVMILANNNKLGYVNGDCGIVLGKETDDNGNETVLVKLARNGREVKVRRIVRDSWTNDKPRGATGAEVKVSPDTRDIYYPDVYSPSHCYRNKDRYLYAQVDYFPLRLAYGATTYKTQGLSLDRIQIDVRDAFMKHPAQVYTSISRCRTPEGIVIVGTPEILGSRVNTNPKVRRFI